MKSSLLTVLGIGLPLVLMMLLWQYLAGAPAPKLESRPQSPAAHLPRSSSADPGRLKRAQPGVQPPARRAQAQDSAWTEAIDGWITHLDRAGNDDPGLQYRQAAILLQQGDFRAAAATFDRLLTRDADNPELLTGKAMALTAMDRHDDALPLFENALRLDAQSVTAHFNYAVALMRAGERAHAAETLQRMVQLDPGYVRAWFNLAILHHADGRHEQALEIWRKLTDGDPTSRPADRQPPAGIALAAKLSPRMLVDAWSHRGELALELKQPAEAEMCFLNVVRLEPRSAIGWCNVGIARADQVRRNDALTALQIALQLDPDLVPALNQSAYLHAAMYRDFGEVEHGRKVVEYCRRSLRIKPDQPNVADLRYAAQWFEPQEDDQ